MEEKPVSAVFRKFLANDPFARQLGIELLEVSPGRSRVRMKTIESHNNFLGFVHGGVIFSLMDYAFSVASNSRNQSAVAVSMSVQYLNAPAPGAVLTADARELEKSRKLGLYELTVTDDQGRLICRSDGRVYRIGKPIIDEPE